ncbi:hypothetical protein LC092_18790 [Stappia stellulata]|uniref:hypothetical protein n=1 Tax=Stappia stellulata TaxID=71235 RepID=UPI001CD5D2AE|nr:hypothetical protein [Stappia stellulata]MCA1244497.1 hypothetical protein [Stappia stellulata]|eukprot:jgi/Tetstr1/425675/TSEL_016095.t1
MSPIHSTAPGRRTAILAGTAVLALALLVPSVADAARPDLRRMTCAQAQAMVAQRGAVVMTTGQYTYQRFVAGPRWCDHWEVVRPEVASTRDTQSCVVGYICEVPLFRPFEWD